MIQLAGNLSAGSLPRVCGDIEDALNAVGAVPEECAQFVGPSMTWNDGTDSNISLSSIGSRLLSLKTRVQSTKLQ
jgi:hypothetical protein